MSQVTKEKAIEDFKVFVNDVEVLARETASHVKQETRERMERGLKRAKECLSELPRQSIETAKASAKATDQYVHDHPWQSVGVAFAVGALIGVLIGRR